MVPNNRSAGKNATVSAFHIWFSTWATAWESASAVRAPMRHKTLLILAIANSIGDRSGE
jgi:hypothetical protein